MSKHMTYKYAEAGTGGADAAERELRSSQMSQVLVVTRIIGYLLASLDTDLEHRAPGAESSP